MKHVDFLNNVERAKLLHELRPQPIKGYLEYAKGLITYLKAHHHEISPTWKNEMFSFTFWLSLAKEIEKKIDLYGNQLCNSSKLFADQLFYDRFALWSADTLLKFTKDPHCQDNKFKHLAYGIFGGGMDDNAAGSEFEKRFNRLIQDAINFIHQTVAPSNKIELEESAGENGKPTGSIVLRRPTSFESINMQAIELDGKEIIIHGTVKRSNQYKPTTIKLNLLDGETALSIADYLANRVVS